MIQAVEMKTIVSVSAGLFLAGCASVHDAGTRPRSAVRTTDLPATYAPLFDGTPMHFDWSYDVDTHDPENPHASVTGKVTCKTNVTTMVEARLAAIECAVVEREGELDVEPTLGWVWIATVDGLWVADDMPAEPAVLAEGLKSAPYLAAVPVAYVEEFPLGEDQWGEEVSNSTTVFQDGDVWCRTNTTPGLYGTSSLTVCFQPGRGLVKVELDNRSGPSLEVYTRQ